MDCDRSCDILIVGAGLAGASTAYHLRRLGAQNVLIVEKESDAGVHSSGRNAAMIRARVGDPDVGAFTQLGAKALALGEHCEYRKCGSVLIGLGTEAASVHFPLAAGKGLWCPDDGVVDPAGLLQSFLRGQEVAYGTQVREWASVDNGFVVQTDAGTIEARTLVNAAGPWAGEVGGIPLAARNRHLYLTPGMDDVDASMPFVWDVVNGLYFRPESGGLLLCACDEDLRAPGDYLIDAKVEQLLAQKLTQLQPRLANVRIKTRWTGQRVFASDEKFVVGFDRRIPGLFHVAGLGGHGVTVSDAVGRFAADCIREARVDCDHPFSPSRLVSSSRASELVSRQYRTS